ncbi:hypothetical protein J6590_058781 [Homalodisca vitripennis]|nr:hypothetical protein J6590_058781 [Homalodisca vitripennis]
MLGVITALYYRQQRHCTIHYNTEHTVPYRLIVSVLSHTLPTRAGGGGCPLGPGGVSPRPSPFKHDYYPPPAPRTSCFTFLLHLFKFVSPAPSSECGDPSSITAQQQLTSAVNRRLYV